MSFKEQTKLEKYLVPVIVGVIAIIFTLFAFVLKQDCDIDKIYLWCRVHPLSIGDIIGLIGFYGGCLIVTGLLPIRLFNEENSVKWNLLWFGLIALSIILIWNT